MEESGSEGLDELVFSRKDTFLKDVDYVCISDNYWLGKTKPCITYGLRGICYFFIEVRADGQAWNWPHSTHASHCWDDVVVRATVVRATILFSFVQWVNYRVKSWVAS